MPQQPTRRPQLPARRDSPGPALDGPAPVEVRLIGDDTAVRRLVDALQQTAHCGPASYRPSRHGDATRAYLTVIVPTQPATSEGTTRP
ncbi:hypothetical protein ABZX40_36445 [Streptomyces sp. NPDC004610]|uniref:hypothetical protein n=1 Tax=unclassified Streptomyces TaxID=2593676 RepID=UPI0033B3B018